MFDLYVMVAVLGIIVGVLALVLVMRLKNRNHPVEPHDDDSFEDKKLTNSLHKYANTDKET